ncbi:MAG: DUF4883 family protein [Clostridiales bacterium]|nr:DUF4883 family protein [Clostridiales bacterium]
MKKFIIILFIIFTLLFQGCNMSDPKYIHFDSKPNNSYYTHLIDSKIINNEDYSIELFNTNMHKRIKIDDSEKVIIKNFIDSLSNDNYKEYEEIDETEIYQIRITFNNEKYIIKIYDKNKISVNPWDGTYEKDIIYMDNIPIRYNLYNFCVHVENRDIYRR